MMRTLVVLFLSVTLLWSPCYRRRSLSTVVFSLREASDTVTPDSVIATPATGASIAAPVPVRFAGHASSNAGVAAVEVAVMDQDSGLWWDAARRSWGDFVWNSADVSTPRAVTTDWSWVFTGTGGSGGYWAMARGKDPDGDVEGTRATTRFTVADPVEGLPTYAGNFAEPAVAELTPWTSR